MLIISDIRKHYEFARYVLPVTEAEIKEQDWPWRKVESRNGPISPSTKSASSNSTLVPEESVGLSETLIREVSASEHSDASDEQRAFLKRISEEFLTIKSFKNNLGEPKCALKLLDGDALEQLESHLSIDDQ